MPSSNVMLSIYAFSIAQSVTNAFEFAEKAGFKLGMKE